ncbi:MobV family relaxase, partial [Acinetobacter towneri]|uniref:MobV family relaxase n=1 Tax=Acinetobacter towneri TaxID=202956 RepID=UPI002936558F
PTRKKNNSHDLPDSALVMDAIKKRMPEKVRKNAVLCVEYLITGSPEWDGWGTDKEAIYFDRAVAFLKKRHGAENVISTSIHRDETTPHLVAYVVPIDERGKLNARAFLGGRGKLSAMQTFFAECVKDLGLERGLEGSKARHTTIKDFYAEVQKPALAAKKLKVLEIEQRLEVPEVGFWGYVGATKKEYASHAQLAAYYFAQQQADAYAADVGAQFSQMQITFEKKLTAERLKAEKSEKAYKRAVHELQALKKKYAVFEELYQLWPSDFEEVERIATEDVAERKRAKAENEKIKEMQRQEKEREHARELERKIEAQKQKEAEFKKKLVVKKEQRLDAQHEAFLERLKRCQSEPERQTVMHLFSEKKAAFTADPLKIMDEVKRSDFGELNLFYKGCISLFRVKNAGDFDFFLDHLTKAFDELAPSYGGAGAAQGPTTRKVCAATSTWLDTLLDRYGSKYEEKAEALREHLHACEEKAEARIFDHVLFDYQTKERIAKNKAEMATIAPSPALEKSRGKDDLEGPSF